MRQLYVITKEIEDVLWKVQDLEGELPPELEEKLNALSGDFDQKIERCLAAWKELISLAEIQKAEARRLTKLAKRNEVEAEWLREYVKRNMETMRKTEHRGPLFPARICNTNPSVTVFDEEKIPGDYWITTETRKLDKRTLLDDLKQGMPISGCKLITEQTHLRISKAKEEDEIEND
jgi:hypothetical protein